MEISIPDYLLLIVVGLMMINVLINLWRIYLIKASRRQDIRIEALELLRTTAGQIVIREELNKQ